MTYSLFKLATMVLKINATVAFQTPPEEFPARTDCMLCIIKDVLSFVAFSHGVGWRCTTHLRRGSRGHREPPVHRRRVHPDDVSAGQGHGKADENTTRHPSLSKESIYPEALVYWVVSCRFHQMDNCGLLPLSLCSLIVPITRRIMRKN